MTREIADVGAAHVDLSCTVNGEAIAARVPVRQHLADFLRADLKLTGTHLGCEHGVCGACTVLVDGRTVRGCLTLACQVDGAQVETIEGLSDRGALAQLQQAFIARNAAQCAFCASGMLLTAYELVTTRAARTREEIRAYISGNMCRCTGYHAIVDAIAAVVEQREAAP